MSNFSLIVLEYSNYDYGKKHNDKSLTLLKNASAKRIKYPVFDLEVDITNIETKITTVYSYIRKAAEAIGSDIKIILRRENCKKLKV